MLKAGYKVIPLGIKKGAIENVPIINDLPELKDIHTISVFVRPDKQKEYLSYILEINPKRIIINPGTENPVFEMKAKRKDIEVIRACTMEMISTKIF